MSLRGARDSDRLIEIARSSDRARDRDYALLVLSYDAPTEAAVEAVIAASVLDPDPRVRLRTREFLAFNLVGVRKRDPKPRLREFMRHGGLRQHWRALRALQRVRKHERMLDHGALSGWRRGDLDQVQTVCHASPRLADAWRRLLAESRQLGVSLWTLAHGGVLAVELLGVRVRLRSSRSRGTAT